MLCFVVDGEHDLSLHVYMYVSQNKSERESMTHQ